MENKNLFTFMAESAARDGFDSIFVEPDANGAKITLEVRLSCRTKPVVKTTRLAFATLEDEAIRCRFRGVPGWTLLLTSRGIRVLSREQKCVNFRQAA